MFGKVPNTPLEQSNAPSQKIVKKTEIWKISSLLITDDQTTETLSI